jgi:hypothetical protein
MGNEIAGAVASAGFWIFLSAVVVTAILAQYFKHRETQKTIREAIEKGQVVGADTVSRLIAANNQPPPNRRGLIFIGTLFVCLGLGLGVIGWTSSAGKPEMFHQTLGAAALLCLLSVPFYVAAWMAPKRNGTEDR